MRIGECDCCARGPRVLHQVTAYGMDTAACAECMGGTAQDVAEELADANEEICPARTDLVSHEWRHAEHSWACSHHNKKC
jgi:hypothetical protein